jgi:peptidoglycan hydrolase-like protein with peptidoglycan-binding domain
VANVSYLRTPAGERDTGKLRGGTDSPSRRRRWGWFVAGGFVLLVIAVLGAGALILGSAHASLTADANGIAKVGMPLGGGKIERVTVVTGPHATPVPVQMRGDTIWPTKLVPANQQLSVDVVVKRPGWVSWIAGSTQKLHLTMTTPVASLRSHYLTVGGHQPLRLHFKAPIRVIAYGPAGHLHRRLLTKPQAVVALPRSTSAGTIFVSAQMRTWESSRRSLVSWFPAGGAATAVSNPSPGTLIKPSTPITLTFSKTVQKALGSHLPPVSPSGAGAWHRLNAHALQFVPSGYGYGLGAKVRIALPNDVKLVGGQQSKAADGGSWTVPPGSTVRLQQVLSLLHYLPLNFKYRGGHGVGLTPADQEAAAIKPPAGHFEWRYDNTPSTLKGFWKPGALGPVTQGALMAFETDHGMVADGVAGPVVWKMLINAVTTGHRSSFGYTFVNVSVASQSLTLWHNGKTVIGGTPVNTGIPSAPTATGTYPVYEHLPVTTMSGTNPDGSHYSDPGIPDVSYFNGGDALHGFTRAQYGSPQSLGCVEMPYSVAAQVYPYTPIGTLVNVE